MKTAKFVLVHAAWIVFWLSPAAAQEEGKWAADSQFAQVNVACTRVYHCGPKTPVMHGADKKVVPKPDKRLVWGVCSAGGGPLDSCNVCATNPPAEKCTWTLESK